MVAASERRSIGYLVFFNVKKSFDVFVCRYTYGCIHTYIHTYIQIMCVKMYVCICMYARMDVRV